MEQFLMFQDREASEKRMCEGKDILCHPLNVLYVYFAFKLRAADLSGELSQPCGDRQALFEQEAVEGVAAECLQIHLVFIIPELTRGVCTDCC